MSDYEEHVRMEERDVVGDLGYWIIAVCGESARPLSQVDFFHSSSSIWLTLTCNVDIALRRHLQAHIYVSWLT